MLPLVSQRKCNQAVWRRESEHVFRNAQFPFSVWVFLKCQSHFWGHENCGKQVWYENALSESLHPSDNEQGGSVLPQSCFFVQCRLSPCSNLGYLAVISLAHCYSHCCCCCCWVGTLSSSVLSPPPFLHTPVEGCPEGDRLAGESTWDVGDLGGRAQHSDVLSKPWPWLNVKTWVHLRGHLLQTRTPERYWSIWKGSSSPR